MCVFNDQECTSCKAANECNKEEKESKPARDLAGVACCCDEQKLATAEKARDCK